MKRVFFLHTLSCVTIFIWFVFNSYVSAQHASLNWGETFLKTPAKLFFLKKDSLSKQSYFFTRDRNSYFVHTYDSLNTIIHSKEIFLPDPEETYVINVLPLSDKIIFLYGKKHKREVSYGLYEYFFNDHSRKSGTMLAKSIVTGKGEYINLSASPDEKHIMVNVIKGYFSHPIGFSYYVLNSENLQIEYSNEHYSIPSNLRIKDLNGDYLMLDNYNHIYFAAVSTTDSSFVTNQQNKEVLYLCVLDAAINNLEKIYCGDMHAEDIMLHAEDSGQIVFTGFYNELSQKENPYYSGIFFVRFNPEQMQVLASTHKSLPANIETKRSKGSDVSYFKTQQYVYRPDGGIYLLSQQVKVSGKNSNLTFGNILIVHLNPNGDTINCTSFPVKQYQLTLYNPLCYYSYVPVFDLYSQKLLLFFNDNANNVVPGFKGQPEVMQYPKLSVLTMASIDEKGTITRNAVRYNNDTSMVFCPAYTDIISSTELSTWSVKNGSARIGTLKLLSEEAKNAAALADTLNQNSPAIGLQRNTSLHKNYLSLVRKKWGICFGNSSNYNGLRFNITDHSVQRINGLNLALLCSYARINNGFTFSLCASKDVILNGLSFASFYNRGHKRTGAVFSFGIIATDKVQGLMVAGFIGISKKVTGAAVSFILATTKITGCAVSFEQFSDTLKGAFASLAIMGTGKTSSHLTGVAGALFGIAIDRVKGFTVACFNFSKEHTGISIGAVNRTKKLNGIQFGFLNYAGNNPKAFRFLPLINMHFGK